MAKPIPFKYTIKDTDNTFIIERYIKFPTEPPIELVKAVKNTIEIAWAEKQVLKERIEELENEIEILKTDLELLSHY